MDLLKKSRGFPTMLVFSKISQNYFCIVKIMDQIYGSRDNDWLLVYGGLAAIGQCGHFKTREVIEIARREEEGGGGVCWGSHEWRRLEAKLRRWPHDGTQQRWSVVLRWRDGSRREEDESWWVQWIMRVLSSCLL
jgi:hypothetical protein